LYCLHFYDIYIQHGVVQTSEGRKGCIILYYIYVGFGGAEEGAGCGVKGVVDGVVGGMVEGAGAGAGA
jgi:hypothetical protein